MLPPHSHSPAGSTVPAASRHQSALVVVVAHSEAEESNFGNDTLVLLLCIKLISEETVTTSFVLKQWRKNCHLSPV